MTLSDQVDAFVGAVAAELGYRHGLSTARDVLLIQSATLGTEIDPQTLEAAAQGAAATFPVKAQDLMPELSGAELGNALKTLESRWISSGFTLTKADLLNSKG